MTDGWHWKVGDKVYHVYHPDYVGTVAKVTNDGGADEVLVQYENVGKWFKAYWLRRAKS